MGATCPRSKYLEVMKPSWECSSVIELLPRAQGPELSSAVLSNSTHTVCQSTNQVMVAYSCNLATEEVTDGNPDLQPSLGYTVGPCPKTEKYKEKKKPYQTIK